LEGEHPIGIASTASSKGMQNLDRNWYNGFITARNSRGAASSAFASHS